MALLEVTGLRTAFHVREGVVRAVDDVSLQVERGQALGIVGESGSGKSVTCLSILGLIPQPPGRIEAGRASLDGLDLLKCSEKQLHAVRGRRIGMVFQDPMTSLNPYLTVGEQLAEPLFIHRLADRAAADKMAAEALWEVGVPDAKRRLNHYPHQFSGGMRQRVMIAMALIAKPELLIADEPTTALDVTVQAQILDLIARQRRERGVAVILISHDLGTVAEFCDQVVVMYAGRIVEAAETAAVFRAPMHPYTRALQRSRPAAQAPGTDLYTIPGMPPDLARPIEGCPFAPRCEFAAEVCRRGDVKLEAIVAGHWSACVRLQRGELALT